MLGSRGDLLRNSVVETQARGGVVAEELAESRLGSRGKQIEPEVCGTDVVGLFNQELAMGVVASCRARKGKSQQETKESEDGAFDHSALRGNLVTNAEAAAKLKQEQHGGKQETTARRMEQRGVARRCESPGPRPFVPRRL